MEIKRIVDRLSDEQKKRVQECKTFEDMVAFVSSLDFELCDEDLESIVGGTNWTRQHLDIFKLGLTR